MLLEVLHVFCVPTSVCKYLDQGPHAALNIVIFFIVQQINCFAVRIDSFILVVWQRSRDLWRTVRVCLGKVSHWKVCMFGVYVVFNGRLVMMGAMAQ